MGRVLYLWIRYYTILLVVFDVVQIHSFAIPGVATKDVCLAMDPTIRIVGAISLWTIEIIMQLRIYALFDRSRKLAIFNAAAFLVSVIAFIVILVVNAIRRPALIASASAVGLPLPGCPVVNDDMKWMQWIPPTVFELILFVQALYKSYTSTSARCKLYQRVSLEDILVHDHMLYFLGISSLLILNNMMVVSATRIPWFGLAPFHSAMGIMTCRMLLHLFKFTSVNLEGGFKSAGDIQTQVLRNAGIRIGSEDMDDHTWNIQNAEDVRISGSSVDADRLSWTSYENDTTLELGNMGFGPVAGPSRQGPIR